MERDRLSLIFGALADPTRRTILARLLEGDATVSELVELASISQPAISRHLKVLEAAGLITRSQSAQWRSSSLDPAALREVVDWMEPYRKFWDESFTRLDAHLKQVRATTGEETRQP